MQGELSRVEVSHLSPEPKARRAALLDALAEYRGRARFPRNEHHAGRRPRFIDDEGNACAVGYLIEVSAGRALAEAIDARFEYDYLLDMHDDRLATWIARSGLTAIELAMIQPSYGHMRPELPRRPVEPAPPPEWTLAELTALLARASSQIEACAAAERARTVRVTVLHDRRRGVRVSVRASSAVGRCAEEVVRASIARARFSAPSRPLRASRTYRLRLSGEGRARQDAARAIDALLPSLARCMPPAERPGKRAVLRVRVDETGRLSLIGARLPIRQPNGRGGSIGSIPWRDRALTCFTRLVGGQRVEAPPRAIELAHRIPWGGSASLLDGIGSGMQARSVP